MSEKIIFLDIDGVSLTGINHLEEKNKLIFKEVEARLKKEDPEIRKYDINKAYSKAAIFDSTAISLLNRLAHKSGAKFVLHSNWRKTVGHKIAKETLIKNGLDEKYFHEDYYCHYKMSSEKIHEIFFWLSDYKEKNKLKEDFKIESIVIDDDMVSRESDIPQVFTNYKDGFTSESYRLAALLLGFEDLTMDITVLDEDLMKVVKESFKYEDDTTIKKWLSEFPEGYTSSRACLLSRNISDQLNNDPHAFFYGVSITNDELYKRRSEHVFEELEIKKEKERIPEEIITSVMDLTRIYKFDIFDEKGQLPKTTPCIMVKKPVDENDMPEYFYPPENVDKLSFLKGYLEAQKNIKT